MHGDAPHGLCCRRGFVSLLLSAAAVTTCGTFLTRPPAFPEQHSPCPCHDTRPVVPCWPRVFLTGPRQPFQLHPLISGWRLAAFSSPEILQLLSALARTWLPHGSETKGEWEQAAQLPLALQPSAMGEKGMVHVSG